MHIIKIAAEVNGAHANQVGQFDVVPDGWAQIPEDMNLPDTFPFVKLTISKGVVKTIKPGTVPQPEKEPERPPIDTDVLNTLLGNQKGNRLQAAEQLRRALQLYAGTLDEAAALEMATVFPAYDVGKAYATGAYITYGTNSVGDPQLYKVVQDHTSQADWPPDTTASLYTPIGLNDVGYPVWSPPSGAHDAYNTGDIVDYNGVLYQSTIDGNIWAPDAYPAGWTIYSD